MFLVDAMLIRAVKFTSNLFGKALQRRIKATILYATETGKSEKFARTLAELFNHAFNAQVKLFSAYLNSTKSPNITNLVHTNLRVPSAFLMHVLIINS